MSKSEAPAFLAGPAPSTNQILGHIADDIGAELRRLIIPEGFYGQIRVDYTLQVSKGFPRHSDVSVHLVIRRLHGDAA